jgi:hypothetical protein
MIDVLFVIAVLTAIAWLPIFMHFYRAWESRRNPISLSICILISFPVYTCMFAYWIMYKVVPLTYTAAVMIGANLVVCALFHTSLYLSQKRFPDTRSK